MITFLDCRENIVETEPKAFFDSYISVGGHKIKATFDLSEVPEEYHQMGLQLIMKGEYI